MKYVTIFRRVSFLWKAIKRLAIKIMTTGHKKWFQNTFFLCVTQCLKFNKLQNINIEK